MANVIFKNVKLGYGFGWTSPDDVFKTEAFEDGLPFLPGMEPEQTRDWAELVKRANAIKGNGRELVQEMWKKHVMTNAAEPDLVLERMRKKIEELEQTYLAAREAEREQERRRVFYEVVAKEEAISAVELEGINCSAETTRDILLAAGYGGKWFRVEKMEPLHQVMTRRLIELGMVECKKVYNEQALEIYAVHRLKGT